MKTRVNQNFIPVEMTREDYHSLCGAEAYPFERIKIGERHTTGILIPAESEEAYRNLIRTLWNDEKEMERERRCMVKSPKSGKIVKCHASCKNCPRLKDGKPLSMDQLYDDNELELPDESQNPEKALADILFDELFRQLEAQSPELAYIFREMYAGIGQREIERELGVPHSTMTDMVKKMRKILQQSVTREDIIG